MQKEYITKNRAKQFVCGHCNEICSEEPCEPSDCDWMAFIDEEPAADVAEVRHGRWIGIDSSFWKPTHRGDIPVFRKTYRCSECRRRTAIAENYCPNCGAKMDKEVVCKENT